MAALCSAGATPSLSGPCLSGPMSAGARAHPLRVPASTCASHLVLLNSSGVPQAKPTLIATGIGTMQAKHQRAEARVDTMGLKSLPWLRLVHTMIHHVN